MYNARADTYSKCPLFFIITSQGLMRLCLRHHQLFQQYSALLFDFGMEGVAVCVHRADAGEAFDL